MNIYRFYPLIFIPLLSLVYYTAFFMMSQTNDYTHGYKWFIVVMMSIQFGALWLISQSLLNRLIRKGWGINLRMFLFGVAVIVVTNNVFYFVIKGIIVTILEPEFEWYNHFILGLSTIEGVLRGIIIMSMLFSLRFFKKWKEESQENEQLKHNEFELQNKALKSQLNPHFLFNNLNALSGLIKKDPAMAEEFLAEMSDMYRYILTATEKEVVSLKKEIRFAEGYSRLLKKRFGKSFDFSIDINDFDYVLPPISLHLLLENIIKHNRIDDEHPMLFSIEQQEKYLLIENKVNLKSNVVSTKKGLLILSEQYKFLTDKPVAITKGDKLFSVKLPLLKLKG